MNWIGLLAGWVIALCVSALLDGALHPPGWGGFLIGCGSAIVFTSLGSRYIGRKRHRDKAQP